MLLVTDKIQCIREGGPVFMKGLLKMLMIYWNVKDSRIFYISSLHGRKAERENFWSWKKPKRKKLRGSLQYSGSESIFKDKGWQVGQVTPGSSAELVTYSVQLHGVGSYFKIQNLDVHIKLNWKACLTHFKIAQ